MATRSSSTPTTPTRPSASDSPCFANNGKDVGKPATEAWRITSRPSLRASETTSEKFIAHLEKDHDDYGSIMAKALADRLAEALAEKLHQQARIDWGFGSEEKLSEDELIDEKYRGIRPAPGYPACPDHTVKGTLWDLLGVEKQIGIKLTESFAMMPAASVSGWYFAHPEAKYFAVDRITRDQVTSYAERAGMTLTEAERWLAPNLSYDPV